MLSKSLLETVVQVMKVVIPITYFTENSILKAVVVGPREYTAEHEGQFIFHGRGLKHKYIF